MLLRPPDDPSPTASRSDTSQPSDSSQATLHDQQPKPIRPLSLLSRFTNASGTGERRPVSSLPLGEEPCTPAALEDWVDDVYRSENPWHGQVRKKHVFSLGKPLPHIGSRQLSGRLERSDVESQEENPLHIDHVNLRSLESQNDTEILAESLRRPSGHRRTVNGVSHGGKYNDVGQPVFDYIPSDENACNHDAGKCNDGTIRGELEDIVKKPSYGIDSEPLGRRETDEVEKGNKDPDEVRNWWARIRARHPEPLAEFLATGVAVFLGLSATLSVNLTANQPVQYGTFEMTCWAWGFAWMLGIYLGGGISGAHMNPVISISLSIFRGFPWRSCAIYIAVQFLAALAAGALAWGIYKDTILSLDPTLDAMSRSFFSSPQAQVSVGTAFLNQVVGSAIMIIAIFALGDDQNNPPGAALGTQLGQRSTPPRISAPGSWFTRLAIENTMSSGQCGGSTAPSSRT
ncbi:hypothetical protein SLS62_007758 [Diatrype stigma]|uniref:Uncharacterized protein n=1 Tax=Diatrype stigma TaxID=117547 RepID=A0AAN9YQH4_9PEZI